MIESCNYCDKMSVVTCFKCGKELCEKHLYFIDGPVLCQSCYEEIKQKKARSKRINRLGMIAISVTVVVAITLLILL